jgi:hypothetical protein
MLCATLPLAHPPARQPCPASGSSAFPARGGTPRRHGDHRQAVQVTQPFAACTPSRQRTALTAGLPLRSLRTHGAKQCRCSCVGGRGGGRRVGRHARRGRGFGGPTHQVRVGEQIQMHGVAAVFKRRHKHLHKHAEALEVARLPRHILDVCRMGARGEGGGGNAQAKVRGKQGDPGGLGARAARSAVQLRVRITWVGAGWEQGVQARAPHGPGSCDNPGQQPLQATPGQHHRPDAMPSAPGQAARAKGACASASCTRQSMRACKCVRGTMGGGLSQTAPQQGLTQRCSAHPAPTHPLRTVSGKVPTPAHAVELLLQINGHCIICNLRHCEHVVDPGYSKGGRGRGGGGGAGWTLEAAAVRTDGGTTATGPMFTSTTAPPAPPQATPPGVVRELRNGQCVPAPVEVDVHGLLALAGAGLRLHLGVRGRFSHAGHPRNDLGVGGQEGDLHVHRQLANALLQPQQPGGPQA